MKVTLINYTRDAVDLLLFTKQTRLNLSPALAADIRDWPHEKRMNELAYMANTIPSSWEFVDYVFLVEGVSRAYTHQQVRTRAASYAQQSLRVTSYAMGNEPQSENYFKKFDYVFTDRNLADKVAVAIIDEVTTYIQRAYNRLIATGQPVEDARGILPTNIATNIVCKFNLRTMSELAASRTGGRTQQEYQKVVNAMIDEVLRVHPWAKDFLFKEERDYFEEIEKFAEHEFGGDLLKKGALLKIVDQMRKRKRQ